MPNYLRQYMPEVHRQLLAHQADTFTFQPAGGAPFQVDLILRPPDQQDGMQAKYITLRGRRSDFPAMPIRGDRCEFGGIVYRVFDAKVNQFGWMTISCEATNDQSL